MKPITLVKVSDHHYNLYVNGEPIVNIGTSAKPVASFKGRANFVNGAPVIVFKTKSEALGVAHSIGRYMLNLGDMVFAYVDYRRESPTGPVMALEETAPAAAAEETPGYPYDKSPSGRYILTRDGKLVMRGTEQEIWTYFHSHHSYSVDHALKYEGFKMQPDTESGGGGVYNAITTGARVTIVDRFGSQRVGRAVMLGPAGWVLNMGGAHGTPAIATPENVVKVTGGSGSKRGIGEEAGEETHVPQGWYSEVSRLLISSGIDNMSADQYARKILASGVGPEEVRHSIATNQWEHLAQWAPGIDEYMRKRKEWLDSMPTPPTATRDHEWVVYPSTRVEGDGQIIHGTSLTRGLNRAVAAAKQIGPGAGVYGITHGGFVGYVTASGRWHPFTYQGQLSKEAGEAPRGGDVDEDALVELHLYADNTVELYPQKQAILKNIERRMRKGTYDPALAPKLWLYWVDEAAKRYTKEFGDKSGTSFGVFNKATREELARRIAEQEYAELMIESGRPAQTVAQIKKAIQARETEAQDFMALDAALAEAQRQGGTHIWYTGGQKDFAYFYVPVEGGYKEIEIFEAAGKYHIAVWGGNTRPDLPRSAQLLHTSAREAGESAPVIHEGAPTTRSAVVIGHPEMQRGYWKVALTDGTIIEASMQSKKNATALAAKINKEGRYYDVFAKQTVALEGRNIETAPKSMKPAKKFKWHRYTEGERIRMYAKGRLGTYWLDRQRPDRRNGILPWVITLDVEGGDSRRLRSFEDRLEARQYAAHYDEITSFNAPAAPPAPPMPPAAPQAAPSAVDAIKKKRFEVAPMAPLGPTAAPDAAPEAGCLPWVRVTRDPERYSACLAVAQKIGPITDARKVYDLLHKSMLKEDQEVFMVVLCDVQGQLRGVAEVHRGARSRVGVAVSDVMRVVLATGSEMFLVAHNHPSGKAKPSDADKHLTEEIKKAVKIYGSEITFVDHVVIGDKQFFSIAEDKLYKA